MPVSTQPLGLAQWRARLEREPLPIQAATHRWLSEAMQHPHLDLPALLPRLSQDAALCLHLVSRANQLSSNPDTEIGRLDLALSTLGITRLQQLLEELPVRPLTLDHFADLQYLHALQNSQHAAFQVTGLSRFSQQSLLNEYRTAALFYGVGYWYLWQFAPQEMTRIQTRIRQESASPTLAEYDVLGCTVQEISQALVRHWRLSRLAEEALEHETSPDHEMLTRLHLRARGYTGFSTEQHRELKHLLQSHALPVKLANWLALSTPWGWAQPRLRDLIDIIADYLRSPVDEVHARLHQRCAEASRELSIPGVMSPGAQMLLIDYDSSPPLANQADQPPPAIESRLPGTEQSHVAFRDEALYRDSLQQLRDKVPRQAEAVLALIARGLHEGLGLQRLICLCAIDGQELRVTLSRGVSSDAPLNRFTQNLQIPSLFKQLARQQRAIWVGPHNQQRVWPLLPLRFRQACDPEGFLLQSLTCDEAPVFIVYADQLGADQHLSNLHLRRFRTLLEQATLALDHCMQKEHP